MRAARRDYINRGRPAPVCYVAAAMLRRALEWLPPLLTAAVAVGVMSHAALLRGPAEWQWAYSRNGLAGGFLALALLVAAIIVWLGGGRAFAGRGLLLALPLGAALTLAVISAEPGGWSRVHAALASPQVFGYVADAGLAPPTAELLASYPEASAALSMHSRTHPPGPILAGRALDAVVRALPLPTSSAMALDAADAMAREQRRARDHGRPEPDHPPAPWTLVVLGWLLPCLGVAVAWPLAVLARDLELPPTAAGGAVALWLLVPARTVFTPSLDQALPLGLVAAVVCARRGVGGAALGGLLTSGLILLSYGFLPWAPVLLALAFLGSEAGERASGWLARDRLRRTGAFLAGLILPLAVLAVGTGFNVVASVRVALERHHAMAIATRSYGTWLLGNPADFALLLGPGVALLLLVGLAPSLRRRVGLAPTPGWQWSFGVRSVGIAIGSLFLLLWLSGSVRGEVGRIWLFFMPFACLFASLSLDAVAEGAQARRTLLAAEALLLLALASSLVFVG